MLLSTVGLAAWLGGGAFEGGLPPSPPTPLALRGRGEYVVFFYGYESTRREGEAPAEPQVVLAPMGLGRSLALPWMRLRAGNPVQVCGWTFPLTPDPSPPAGARGVCCVFYGYESTRREGEAPAEPQVVLAPMGLGRSLALPWLRLRAENPVQVCRGTCPLTPDPSPPAGARGGF